MAGTSSAYRAPINKITGQIIGAAIKVHTALGPGLLESAYHACLLRELRKQNCLVASQVALPVVYDGEKLDLGYRIDLLVENAVIVEIKCVEAIHPVHKAQLLSYRRLSGTRVGLLVNFYVTRLQDGITRMVDGYEWRNPACAGERKLYSVRLRTKRPAIPSVLVCPCSLPETP
jgi:GxxExxY protein